MSKQLLRDAFGWGFLLWLLGYILGILLFPVVPLSMIGWVITPIGMAMTLWVLWKKIAGFTLRYYLLVSCVWTTIAILFDYLFLVQLFKPADGYYKPDVYLYYMLTLLLPSFIGWKKLRK